MKRAIPVAVVLTIGAWALGCRSGSNLEAAVKHSQQMASVADSVARDSLRATVRVENNGFPDVVVYVIPEGGVRRRMGTAVGHTTTVLTIPQTVIFSGGSQLQFLVDPIGGSGEALSDKIYVLPGDEVTLTIPPS
jgi:hypothetical protein